MNERQLTSGVEWTAAALKADMLEQFKEFHPDAVALLSKAGDIGYWPLFDMPSLKNWVNGRVALLGDAAHPFLPCKNSPLLLPHLLDASTNFESPPSPSTRSSPGDRRRCNFG